MQPNDIRRTISSRKNNIIDYDITLSIIRKHYNIPLDIINYIQNFIICPHKDLCHLKSTLKCCKCSDKSKIIYRYVDGKGITQIKNENLDHRFKSKYYCPGCTTNRR
jgi:hypothetical protein